MAALLQSLPNPITMRDVAEISQTLAEDLSKLEWHSEGFSVEDYMTLDGAYFVEYIDGCLQVLPMPSAIHQVISHILCALLMAWTKHDPDARALGAPFKIILRDGRYREPDVCYMRGINAHRRTPKFWTGADLVIEVISDSNRNHDWITKRREYAINGVPEYWIVDPDQRLISVLTLRNDAYEIAGEYRDSQQACSVLLEGFAVDVKKLFDDALAAS